VAARSGDPDAARMMLRSAIDAAAAAGLAIEEVAAIDALLVLDPDADAAAMLTTRRAELAGSCGIVRSLAVV